MDDDGSEDDMTKHVFKEYATENEDGHRATYWRKSTTEHRGAIKALAETFLLAVHAPIGLINQVFLLDPTVSGIHQISDIKHS